jgi:aryl-alcohol dehydrogenase-like predicted oxidoreductase
MEYRRVGSSGLKVSVVSVGCGYFGVRLDDEQCRAIVDRAFDEGISLFDTSDFYAKGGSEEMLGKALSGRRHEAVVATKFGLPMGRGPYPLGASRRYIMSAVEASLRRLDTDYIDLYQIHHPDPETPQEETLEALADLVRSGKVRYVGSSNFSGWQIASANSIARHRGIPEYISAQNEYNLLKRDIEAELIPACRHFSVGVLTYWPLAAGFLTGKYRRGAPFPQDTRMGEPVQVLHAEDEGFFQAGARSVLSDRNFSILEALEEFAQAHGHTMLELAVGWLVSQRQVSSVICGATKPDQITQNASASAAWRLTPDELGEIHKITRPAWVDDEREEFIKFMYRNNR